MAQIPVVQVGADGNMIPITDINAGELALEHLLDEYTVLATGGTPDSIKNTIINHLDELTNITARLLMGAAILSTITQRVNLEAFFTKNPAIVSFINRHFWIGTSFNFGNLNLLGHMLLSALPDNFNDKYLLNAREKIGAANIWATNGRYAKISDKQAQIFDERRRRHSAEDAKTNGIIVAGHLLYKIGFHPVAINYLFGIAVFPAETPAPENVLPQTVPVTPAQANVPPPPADPMRT